MKVGYRKLNGFVSTAYLDDDDIIDGQTLYAGEDKYTGAPVTVQWDDDCDEWKEQDA